MQKITTFLTFESRADEAVRLYTSIFADSRIVSSSPGPNGTVMTLTFELFGQTFIALNAGPGFSFASGMSLFVRCEDQAEIDGYWEKLTAEGGKEVMCGWLVDRFGVSWQIVPNGLDALLGDPDRAKGGRAMAAMMKMKKLDIAALKRAHAGE